MIFKLVSLRLQAAAAPDAPAPMIRMSTLVTADTFLAPGKLFCAAFFKDSTAFPVVQNMKNEVLKVWHMLTISHQ